MCNNFIFNGFIQSDGVTVGSGVGVSGSGVGVSGSGVGVSGSGAGVSGSGAGVFGSGAGVSLPSEITSPLPSPKSLAVSICSSDCDAIGSNCNTGADCDTIGSNCNTESGTDKCNRI